MKKNVSVTQSVAGPTRTPPLKARRPDMNAQKPDQVRASVMPNYDPSKSKASPKLMAARAAAEKARGPDTTDYFAETERLRKEDEKEFGIKVTEEEAHLPWIDHVDELNQKLQDNLKNASEIDTSIINTFDDAHNAVEIDNDDVFGTVKKMVDAGFDSFSDKMNKDRQLLRERMGLMQEMMEEITSHSAATEYTADLVNDEDVHFDDDSTNDSSILARKAGQRPRLSPNTRKKP